MWIKNGVWSLASLSEWLRSLTRNQMGSARTGSNPVARAPFLRNFFKERSFFCFIFYLYAIIIFKKKNLRFSRGVADKNCDRYWSYTVMTGCEEFSKIVEPSRRT